MPGEEEEIRLALDQMFDRKIPLTASWFTVSEVGERTCTIVIDEDHDLKVEGILLGFDKSDLIVHPKINTDVLVIFTDGSRTNGMVLKCQETEKVSIMGDEFEGIPKVKSVLDDINDLKSELNDLKTILFTTWVPVPNDGGAALKTAAATWAGIMMVPTQQSTLENTKVKHGKG